MIDGATLSVLDYMTPAQITDVQSYTASIDVSDAVQAAFDAAKNNNAQTVHFPDGTYLLHDIDISSPGGGVEAYRNINVKCDGRAYFTAPDNTTDIFDISGQRRLTWSGGQFLKARRCFAATNPAPIAYCSFNDIRFRPSATDAIVVGFYGDNYIGNNWTNCQFGWDNVNDGINTGVHFTGASDQQNNVNKFTNCVFINFKDYGLRMDAGVLAAKATTGLYGCWFESAEGIAIYARGITYQITVETCYFEAVQNAVDWQFVTQGRITNCYFVNPIYTMGSWITIDGGKTVISNNNAFVDAFPLVAYTNISNNTQILENNVLNDFSGTNPSYKSVLFSADDDETEQLIKWTIGSNSGTTSDDEFFSIYNPEVRVINNGFSTYRTSGVTLTADLTWYDVASINIAGSGSTGCRVTAELETLHDGVGAVAYFLDAFITRDSGTVTVTNISTANVGGTIDLQFVSDGTNAKLQARRNGGNATGVSPIIRMTQADGNISDRRITLT